MNDALWNIHLSMRHWLGHFERQIVSKWCSAPVTIRLKVYSWWVDVESKPFFHLWRWVMMTSSNGSIFRVTGPLWGEFTGHRWIPLTKASDAELYVFFHLCLNKQFSKQPKRWRFETPPRSLWRSINVGGNIGWGGGVNNANLFLWTKCLYFDWTYTFLFQFCKIQVKTHVNWQGFSNMTLYWLIDMVLTNRMPALIIFINQPRFKQRNFLVTGAPDPLT